MSNRADPDRIALARDLTKETAEASRLTLFTNGGAPRSRRARSNLKRALARLGSGAPSAEEIDLSERPRRALTANLATAPALVGLKANGQRQILYGDLSEEARLDALLRELLATA
jgi:circadian clock protein KaiB